MSGTAKAEILPSERLRLAMMVAPAGSNGVVEMNLSTAEALLAELRAVREAKCDEFVARARIVDSASEAIRQSDDIRRKARRDLWASLAILAATVALLVSGAWP